MNYRRKEIEEFIEKDTLHNLEFSQAEKEQKALDLFGKGEVGLKVNRYKFLQENGREYTIVLGEKANRRMAIVWRPTKSINLEKDKDVIDKAIGDFEPDEVFINGDAFYPKGYKVIETEFKTLMGV